MCAWNTSISLRRSKEIDDASYDLWLRPDILCKPKFVKRNDHVLYETRCVKENNVNEIPDSFHESEEKRTEVGTSEHLSEEESASTEADDNAVQREWKDTEVQTELQETPRYSGEPPREKTAEAEVQTEIQELLPLSEEDDSQCAPALSLSEPRAAPDEQTPEPLVPSTLMQAYLGSADQYDGVLPKDKQGLLELRAKVALELMWVNQAIASRRKYLEFMDSLNADS